jgi:hypothetical protein
MDFATFRTDETAENEGVWIDIGPDCALLIGRLASKRHSECFRRMTSAPSIKKALDANSLSAEESARIQGEVLAETILLGWRGLQENGAEIPYSKEKARELLTVKDFRALVQDEAAKQSNFRVKEITEAVDALKKKLIWQLRVGDNLQRFQNLKEDGASVPILDDEPKLSFPLQEIWHGFSALSSSRQMGFDVGAIPLTEIKAYVDLFGVVDLEMFVACVRALDADYLKHVREKNAQKT